MDGEREQEREIEEKWALGRRLCALANKWPAITCNLPYIPAPWPPPRVRADNSSTFLVFVAVFGAELHPRGHTSIAR